MPQYSELSTQSLPSLVRGTTQPAKQRRIQGRRNRRRKLMKDTVPKPPQLSRPKESERLKLDIRHIMPSSSNYWESSAASLNCRQMELYGRPLTRIIRVVYRGVGHGSHWTILPEEWLTGSWVRNVGSIRNLSDSCLALAACV